jgi:ankyrin repeat protein
MKRKTEFVYLFVQPTGRGRKKKNKEMSCCNRDASWVRAFPTTAAYLAYSKSDLSWKKGRERSSAMHVAAELGRRDVCEFLLLRRVGGEERTRLLNKTDDLGRTPMCVAAERGHLDVCVFLADSGASFQTPRDDGATPLSVACQAGHLDVCRFLLEKGVESNSKDVYGNTPLMFAASQGHARICEALLNAGAAPDLADEDGITPLFAACQEERTDVCRLLIRRGAVRSISPCNVTPGMWVALFSEDRELAAILGAGGMQHTVVDLDDIRNLELSKERRVRIREMKGRPIPPSFLCAVTGRLLVHPVIAGDGDSRVERYVAERHISLVGTDPISGRPRTISELQDDVDLFAREV